MAMLGKHLFMEALRAHGVKYVFGNPGTTESPFMDALQDYPDLRYVLTLQESVALSMADAYARSTGRPAFVNVHIAAGLANAMSMLYDAYRGGTPLVLTAGQSDTRMFLHEPLISGNLVQMTSQYTKWSAEVLHAADLPMAVRRAFKVAAEPPTGPVFLSLPWNVLDASTEAPVEPPAPAYLRTRPDREAVERAASLLASARSPVIILGDRVAQSGAVDELVGVAERLGAPVYASVFSEVNFPTSHPQYVGMLSAGPGGRATLANADVILAIGTNLFTQFVHYDEPLVGERTQIVHIDSSDWQIGRSYRAEVGIHADPKAALVDLLAALDGDNGPDRRTAGERAAHVADQKRRQREAAQREVQERWEQVPISPARLMHEVAAVRPTNAIIVDEAISNSGALHNATSFDRPGDYFRIRGGAIGWGMGGALGVQLANPERPTIALVGDGSAMYSIQALWTAAHEQLPVKYVLLSNRAYRVLKINLAQYLGEAAGRSKFVGMDITDPDLNFARLAAAFDIPAWRIEHPDDLRPTFEKALAVSGPALVDVVVDGSFSLGR